MLFGHERSSDRPSVVIFGLFGVGNLGNEASLTAALQQLTLSMPDAELHCVAALPDAVAAQFGRRTYALRPTVPVANRFARIFLRIVGAPVLWYRVWRWLRQHNALVIPGTGILDDFGERPIDMPLHIYLWSHLARLAGVEIHLVSVGAGPISGSLNRELLLAAPRLARSCSVRDEGSRQFLSEAGIPITGIAVRPDVVFGISRPPPARQTDDGGPPVVGVGVMRYFGWRGQRFQDAASPVYRAYLVRLALLVDELLEAGFEVHLVHGEDGDAEAMDDILTGVEHIGRHSALEVDRTEAKTFEELLEVVGGFDLLVATRFHNVVAGLMMGRPVISLGYAEKNGAVMRDFGLDDFCHDVERFEVDVVLHQVRELQTGAGPTPSSLEARAEMLAAAVRSEFAELGTRIRAAHEEEPD